MERGDRPVIGFLSDFGLDGAAATCRGVVLGICRDAQIVDISHTVRKYAVADGAYLLRASLPYLPVGVHLAVVDPGVGTARRPVAIEVARGDVLVGPDNGLLLPAADALGGAVGIRVLDNRDLWLPAATATFHARDIFAPVAAHLAAGDAHFADVGPAIAVQAAVRLPEPEIHAADGALETVVTYVDSFGNLRLGGGRVELERAFGQLAEGTTLHVELRAAGVEPRHELARFARTFGDVPIGALLVYIDSLGNLALADNHGDAAHRMGVVADTRVRISQP